MCEQVEVYLDTDAAHRVTHLFNSMSLYQGRGGDPLGDPCLVFASTLTIDSLTAKKMTNFEGVVSDCTNVLFFRLGFTWTRAVISSLLSTVKQTFVWRCLFI